MGLLLNIVVYWNTYYLDLALTDLLKHDDDVAYNELTHITPLAYAHVRVLGRYHFTLHSLAQQGQARLLKPLKLD